MYSTMLYNLQILYTQRVHNVCVYIHSIHVPQKTISNITCIQTISLHHISICKCICIHMTYTINGTWLGVVSPRGSCIRTAARYLLLFLVLPHDIKAVPDPSKPESEQSPCVWMDQCGQVWIKPKKNRCFSYSNPQNGLDGS